jgi:hypothetical protein
LNLEVWTSKETGPDSFVDDSHLTQPQPWKSIHYPEPHVDWIFNPRPRALDRPPKDEEFDRAISRAIDSSAWILSLPANFDGEGSPAYTQSVWNRAVSLLHQLRALAEKSGRSGFPLPRITPGPSGSIDLFWETGSFELLVNLPEDLQAPLTFDGDNFGEVKLNGLLKPGESVETILRWIQVP